MLKMMNCSGNGVIVNVEDKERDNQNKGMMKFYPNWIADWTPKYSSWSVPSEA
jgi:hypothetical protein